MNLNNYIKSEKSEEISFDLFDEEITNIEEENVYGKTQMPGNSIVGDTFPGVDYVVFLVSPTNPMLKLRVILKEKF